MNQKVLKTLEYYKIIERLIDCAASEPGKKMCRELTPSSDFNEIVQAQTETADAVTRVRQKGSLSLAGVRDVRDSLKRLEIGSSLSIMELLSVSGLLTCAARAKNYGRHPENMDHSGELALILGADREAVTPVTHGDHQAKQRTP